MTEHFNADYLENEFREILTKLDGVAEQLIALSQTHADGRENRLHRIQEISRSFLALLEELRTAPAAQMSNNRAELDDRLLSIALSICDEIAKG